MIRGRAPREEMKAENSLTFFSGTSSDGVKMYHAFSIIRSVAFS